MSSACVTQQTTDKQHRTADQRESKRRLRKCITKTLK
uniref:Uncharacterized protein n=1 Tax=Anguilla anguilla TaxID=7936 RepID=A0A0E9VA68_ANGAN